MTRHRTLANEDIHGPYRKTFADAAARTGDTGPYLSSESILGGSENPAKSLQLDTLTEYVLENHSPITWVPYTASGGGGAGTIYITDIDVQVSGTVSGKAYQDAGNTVLQACTSSSPDITVSVRSSYPEVEVNGIPASLTRDVSGGFYSGDVDVTIVGSGDVTAQVMTPDDESGSIATCAVTLEEPPVLLSLSFTGGYPGAQTELKEDDTFGIAGTADKDIDAIEVADWGAAKSAMIPVATGTAFSTSLTIDDEGDVAVARPARVRSRDAVTGAWGPYRDTNLGGGSTDGVDVVTCNNLHPSVSIGAITYPGAQQALKNSESALVANTCSDFDSILYSDPTASQLNIANTTTYEASKSVTRIGGGYNISTNNFRVTANRAANDADTVANVVVQIAHNAAQISVSEPAARLRSGGNDGTSAQNHTITISSDQNLLSIPSMDEDTGGGTFLGSWAQVNPTTYTRSLQVHDNDVKATYNWQNLSAFNLAGIETTVITGDSSYVLGGFVARTVTWAAFQQATTVNVAVVDYSKVQAGDWEATGQPSIRHTPQGDHADAANEYTVDSPLNTRPQTVWWNDVLAASSNSGTADLYNFEEVV